MTALAVDEHEHLIRTEAAQRRRIDVVGAVGDRLRHREVARLELASTRPVSVRPLREMSSEVITSTATGESTFVRGVREPTAMTVS